MHGMSSDRQWTMVFLFHQFGSESERGANVRSLWAYVGPILTTSAARPRTAAFSDLVADAWAQAGAGPSPAAD
jgi:hypothetical protein